MTRDEVIKWFGDLGWPVARLKRGLPVRSDKFEVRTGKMKISIRTIVEPRPVKFRRGNMEYYAPYPLLASSYYGSLWVELRVPSGPHHKMIGGLGLISKGFTRENLRYAPFVPGKTPKSIEDNVPAAVSEPAPRPFADPATKRVGINGVNADPVAYVIRFGSSSKAYMTHEALLDTRLQQLRKRKVRFSIEPLYRFPEV